MWAILKVFLGAIFASPVTKVIVAQTVKDITTAGVNVIQAAVTVIPQAAAMENTKGTDKLNYVVDKLKDEVEDLPKAMLTNVVTSVYRSLNVEGKV